MNALEAKTVSRRARIKKIDHLTDLINTSAAKGEDCAYSNNLTHEEISILEDDLGYKVTKDDEYFKISW